MIILGRKRTVGESVEFERRIRRSRVGVSPVCRDTRQITHINVVKHDTCASLD